MGMRITVDDNGLARDLADAHEELKRELHQVTKRGANNIKKDWRKLWGNLRDGHAKHLPRTIGYDLNVSHGGLVVEAEIGVEISRMQWGLGHLIEQDREYGNLFNAPQPAGKPALDSEKPRYERHLAELAAHLLVGRR